MRIVKLLTRLLIVVAVAGMSSTALGQDEGTAPPQPIDLQRRKAALVRGPWIGNVTATGATIRWQTDGAAASLVVREVGLITVRVTGTATALPGGGYRHTVRLAKLSPGTSYRVRITDLAKPATATFRTWGPSARFRFVAFGDFQCGDTTVLRHIATEVPGDRPALYLSTGDVTDGASPCWDDFFGGATFLSRGAFYAAGGNNDALADWASLFDLPGFTPGKPYYSFRYGNTRFLMLYAGVSDDDARFPPVSAAPDCKAPASQTDWVYCELRGASLEKGVANVVAVVHMPPFTYPGVGGHPGKSDEQANLVPLLRASPKVRVVLSGHNHFYQRIVKWRAPLGWPSLRPGRLHYLVLGGGGAGLYPPTEEPAAHPDIKEQAMAHHFAIFDVDGAEITVTVKKVEGGVWSVLESFTP